MMGCFVYFCMALYLLIFSTTHSWIYMTKIFKGYSTIGFSKKAILINALDNNSLSGYLKNPSTLPQYSIILLYNNGNL